MSQSVKEQIDELKRQRKELNEKIKSLETKRVQFGRVRLDDQGVSILCDNINCWRVKSESWRLVIASTQRLKDEKVRRRDTEQIKSEIKSIISDLEDALENM